MFDESFFHKPLSISRRFHVPISNMKADMDIRGVWSEAAVALFGTAQRSAGVKHQLFPGGKIVIPIYGIISKRPNDLLRTIDENAATDEIRDCFSWAISNPSVQKIVFDIDSSGGEIVAAEGLSELIFLSRGVKSIIACANGEMLGAAYWIGSAADKVYATKTSRIGEVGVCSVVNDYTVANHIQGIKNEFVKAGRFKASGHPDKLFTDDDRMAKQEEVNAYYELFLKAIKRNRGLSEKELDVIGDANVFIGTQALKVRLIDGIGEADSV